jgi:hypothetical protein
VRGRRRAWSPFSFESHPAPPNAIMRDLDLEESRLEG